MAEETHVAEAPREPRKRKIGKSSKSKKKAKFQQPSEGMRGMKPKKIDKKMKKLYRKRARDYNSEDEEAEHDDSKPLRNNEKDLGGGCSSEEEAEIGGDHNRKNADDGLLDDDEAGEILPGIMKFTNGSNAFRLAFKSIIKKSMPEDVLGPVLSGQKKLIGEKLAEEESERNAKGVAKKEKQLVIEKGHVIPANYLNMDEKFLIGVATKGVVKLFNAVSKAQNAQKGLNPSKFKDAKVIKRRRKEAFFSELGKTPSQTAKAHNSKGKEDGEGPAWAPLQDNYMLTNPKLKDWDKMPETTVEDGIGRMSEDSSDDD